MPSDHDQQAVDKWTQWQREAPGGESVRWWLRRQGRRGELQYQGSTGAPSYLILIYLISTAKRSVAAGVVGVISVSLRSTSDSNSELYINTVYE